MSVEPLTKAETTSLSRMRVDLTPSSRLADRFSVRALAFTLFGGFFLVFGGANLDLGPIESRLGLAAEESFRPLGEVMGGWEPSVWPGRLAPSLLWGWLEGGFPTKGAVRWPDAIAGLAIGYLLARRAVLTAGGRSGILVALTWFGSLALMDRSAGAGIDLVTGLFTVAALDRLLTKGSDLVSGLLAAFAFLCGGWPPLALIVLSTIVIGKSGAMVNGRLLLFPAVTLFGWSLWAIKATSGEAWGAALALPLTQRPAWFLAIGVLSLGLPWSPFLLLQGSRTFRDGLTPNARGLSMAWLQLAGAALVVGTLIPGLAEVSKAGALAALAISSGITIEGAVFRPSSPRTRISFLGLAMALSLVWFVIAMAAGGYLAAAVSYYRATAIVLILCTLPVLGICWYAFETNERRLGLLAMVGLAVFLKFAHWGYYVPEWNYRRSQGPWGRAIGQWVPPRWPVYTTHTWNTDLAFAIGKPIVQILSDRHLRYQPGEAKFVLLLEGEFKEWSTEAPKISRVASFQDERGHVRVLARTAGPLPWIRKTTSSATIDE